MRLKFLFFPAILVISLSLIIGNVWPEYSNMQENNKKYTENKKVLGDLNEKLVNIKMLSTDLDENKEKTAQIFTYLPYERNEERVLDSLNYLAAGAGVSLVNISLEKDAIPQSSDDLEIKSPWLTTGNGSKTQIETVPAVAVIDSGLKSEVNFSKSTVSIFGEYEKILMYLDQIQKSNMYNVISGVKISQQKTLQAKTEEASADPSNLLSAEIMVNFGYLPLTKGASYSDLSLKNTKADFVVLDDFKTFVSQQVPEIQKISGRGNNPFFQ